VLKEMSVLVFIYLFILPHHKYNENNKRKIERVKLHPTSNFEFALRKRKKETVVLHRWEV